MSRVDPVGVFVLIVGLLSQIVCSTDGSDGTAGTDSAVSDCPEQGATKGVESAAGSVDDLWLALTAGEAGLADTVERMLERRYPAGAWLLREGRATQPDCFDRFSGTFERVDIWAALPVAVHECGHYLDLAGDDSGPPVQFVVNDELRFSCRDGGRRPEGKTFARSRINRDPFGALYSPCNGGGPQGCDGYADLYLDGDPDDEQPQRGDGGFDLLAEEALQYTNSLATVNAFRDQYDDGGRTSERDGVLVHMWYLQRYLRMARTSYPHTYALLRDDSCWRGLVVAIWSRAVAVLELTRDAAHLGVEDDLILPLVKDPELLAEIQTLREAAACPGQTPTPQ